MGALRAFAGTLCLLLLPALAGAQTAIRPDQISPGTPDITWGPGGSGYQIGTTVAWRTDSTNAVTLTSADIAKIVELTYSGAGTIAVALPQATGALGDGAGLTIQIASGTATITPAISTINNLTSIKIGPYQSVGLSSKGGNWYATESVPQPPTQTGTTQLCDTMVWSPTCVAAGGAPTGSCSQSTAFFARVWALPATLDGVVGGTASATNHVAAYDNMICQLVANGEWAKLDVMYVYATAAATGTSTAVANLNLVSSSYTAIVNGAVTFVANAGYTGVDSSTTAYIDTQFNPVTATPTPHWQQNAAAMMACSFTNNSNPNAGVMIGNNDGTNTNQMFANDGGQDYLWMQQADGVGFAQNATTGAAGCFAGIRYATGMGLFKNGSAGGTITTTATATISRNLYVLGRNKSTGPDSGLNQQLSVVTLGANPTSAVNLYNPVCTYLTAVHGSC